MLTKRALVGSLAGAAVVSPSAALPLATPSMSLAEAKARLERGFVVKEGMKTRMCQTGEEYPTFRAGGTHKDGSSNIPICLSADEAVARWYDTVSFYARHKRGTLYWRVEPELYHWVTDTFHQENWPGINAGTTGWQVYSRFLISDKPERFSEVDEATKAQHG